MLTTKEKKFDMSELSPLSPISPDITTMPVATDKEVDVVKNQVETL